MNTLAYELVALAMVVAALAGLILAYCLIHHAIFTAIDRYRAAQSTSGDPLACHVCRRRCIPDATGLCDACAETSDGLLDAELQRLIEGTQP